jgi:hypothetical protein
MSAWWLKRTITVAVAERGQPVQMDLYRLEPEGESASRSRRVTRSRPTAAS